MFNSFNIFLGVDYSQVPNKRPSPLINFSIFFRPPRTLLGLPRLLIFKENMTMQLFFLYWSRPLFKIK